MQNVSIAISHPHFAKGSCCYVEVRDSFHHLISG